VVRFTIDDAYVTAAPGDTVAVALLNAGRRAWRLTDDSQPRGVFCAIGVCFDCTLTVDGIADVRACMTPARDGMRIITECAP
jgi:predicted molibdopterin-dependent oxidoreductase YjgC